MSSRQEEKERRRREREEQERAEARAAARTRRVQLVVGGVLAAAIVVALVVALTSGGSDNGPSSTGEGANVPIPKPKEHDLAKAAAAAGCVLTNPPAEGSTHTTKPVKYKTNPPTSGDHNPIPAEDGIYKVGNTPAKEHFVHSLEHGRIEVQYRPGTSRHQIDQLETLFNEKVNGTAGYHTLLFENNTNMPFAVAATAWTHSLGCKTFNPRIFDAIRDFRTTYTDKAPEFIP
jgi:hypothetical protein